jgi:ubiquinone/menaquinone biosynthesis C-methylase UbiE
MFLGLFANGCWMLYGIKISKPKIIAKIVQSLKLTGSETVLDLGCGRGLLLCEVAKCLPHGKVHGIDLWVTKDQSGNTPQTALRNAEREGVQARVSIHTGDVRKLPFPDSTFAAVVSSLCLHNIADRKGREQAILEMLRVLKPEGKFVIADIQCAKEYAELLIAKGINVERSKPDYSYCPPITILKGRK